MELYARPYTLYFRFVILKHVDGNRHFEIWEMFQCFFGDSSALPSRILFLNIYICMLVCLGAKTTRTDSFMTIFNKLSVSTILHSGHDSPSEFGMCVMYWMYRNVLNVLISYTSILISSADVISHVLHPYNRLCIVTTRSR